MPERDDQHTVAPIIVDPHVTTIRPPACVELERAVRPCESLVQEISVNLHVIIPALMDAPAVIAGQANRHARKPETCGVAG